MRRKTIYVNRLKLYRQRTGIRQKRMAALLGHADSTLLSLWESGQNLPGLKDAMRLGIILRVPVEFLYPPLYDVLREAIRLKEGGATPDTPGTEGRYDNP